MFEKMIFIIFLINAKILFYNKYYMKIKKIVKKIIVAIKNDE